MYTIETTEMPMLTPEDDAAIRAIVAGLEASWNTADGAAYGRPFAADADFVPIYGQFFSGRAAIAAGHQQIFDTVYRGSRNSATIEGLRLLAPGVALARVTWCLRVPDGAAMREGRSRNSIVLTHGGTGWEIAAFHNTLIAQPGATGPFAART